MPGFLGGAAKGLYAYAVRQEDEERKMREKEADRAYQRSENDRIYDRNRTDQLQDKQDEAASNPENYTINGDVAEGVIYVRGEPVKFTAPKGSAVYNRALLDKESKDVKLRTEKARLTQEEFAAGEGLNMRRQEHRSKMLNDQVERANSGRRGSSDKEMLTAGKAIRDALVKGNINKYELSIPVVEFNKKYMEKLGEYGLDTKKYSNKGSLQFLASDAAEGDVDAQAVLEELAPYLRLRVGKDSEDPNKPDDGNIGPPVKQ